jgi:hypothetical protein
MLLRVKKRETEIVTEIRCVLHAMDVIAVKYQKLISDGGAVSSVSAADAIADK